MDPLNIYSSSNSAIKSKFETTGWASAWTGQQSPRPIRCDNLLSKWVHILHSMIYRNSGQQNSRWLRALIGVYHTRLIRWHSKYVNKLTTDLGSEVVQDLWHHITHFLKLLMVTDEQRVVTVTAAATASNVIKLMTLKSTLTLKNISFKMNIYVK